jgi:hypothetical protein
MYGSGMSRLVKASGRENHDGEAAAGMLSNEGRYADAAAAGLPKSDSPLGRAFMGDEERVWL